MKNNYSRTLILGAVQIEAQFGKVQENLERAEKLVSAAAAQGTQLVTLPELMPSGYMLSEALWDYAEPAGGITECWLKETARRLKIHLGVSYLQAEGSDFFNTFSLATPLGQIAGRVRKQFPAFSEPYFFLGQAGDHVIDTAIGRVGVGICNDNHKTVFGSILQRSQIDLLLMPHGWPLPIKTGKAISQEDINHQREIATGIAPMYARLFGIPTVMVNHCGLCAQMTPPGLVAKLLPPADFYRYPGLSMVVDSDGSVKAQAGSEEAFVAAPVLLDPARKCNQPLPDFNGRVYPGSAGRDLVKVDEGLGRVSYSLSSRRKQKAQEIHHR